MHDESIIVIRIVGDSIPVRHFSIAENVSDRLVVEPDISPTRKMSLLRCHQCSAVGCQIHAAVDSWMLCTMSLLQKTVTLDWLSNKIQSRITSAYWWNCMSMWAPAHPVWLALDEGAVDCGAGIDTDATVLESDDPASSRLCVALLCLVYHPLLFWFTLIPARR